MTKSDIKIDQPAYLQCQRLINRISSREKKDQGISTKLHQIMMALLSHQFKSTSEFTTTIKEVIFEAISENNEDAERLFEYANE